MSILDIWEHNVVSFSRKTKEKAVSMSEIARLRSLIAGEEKNCHSLCSQIGEKYAELHRQDYTPEFQELMTLVEESRQRCEGYVNQINAIRKVRPCPSCGAEVPLDFAYCNFCGAKLPEVEPIVPDGYQKCQGCGAVIPESMRFCNHCGREQNPAREAEVVSTEPSEGPETREAINAADAPEASQTAEAGEKSASSAADSDTPCAL